MKPEKNVPVNNINTIDFEAVIFDLDGVITDTAKTHAMAWKTIFDEFLIKQENKNEPFREFTQDDYLDFVDGKPRYKGVASFLKSRGIELPWGSPDDDPENETVCGLGNRKNEVFTKVLKKEGAEVYPASKKILLDLNEAGVKLGVASSSKNCKTVLETVGLLHLFSARVDGIVSAELGLQGKPEPDIFTKACEMLNAKPAQSIVVEDAVSGVQAGSKGGFGLTLGIARKDNSSELKKHGADYVISGFEEIDGIAELNKLFLKFKKE
jgi:beta-phosphoglucomutase family hydrolase